MGAKGGIEHVIVLMLENRSFDSVLGKLYPKGETFNGLSGDETNPSSLGPVAVWNDTGMDPRTATIPDPDPGELFDDMNLQLFGLNVAPSAAPPAMDGFVMDYVRQTEGTKQPDPKAVMHYFTPEQVPVISQLAKAFGICDQWHAAAPCQTWPNRFFAHTGTAGGYVDNAHFQIPFTHPSIFRRMSDKAKSWNIYFHDVAQSVLLEDIILEAPWKFKRFQHFLDDAQKGLLPNYSFIEPRYFPDPLDGSIPNDQHPPHNMVYGEQLIAAVYNAVRSSPCWKQSLLVVTYDEHGGCFDHAPPPLAVPPDSHRQDGFAFDRYGVRVPAVVISPYCPPGARIRSAPSGLRHDKPPYPFDHTSIISTLRDLFDLGGQLTDRDAHAPTLTDALSLADPSNDGPSRIAAPEYDPSAAEVADRSQAPANGMQTVLAAAGRRLSQQATATAGAVPLPVGAPIPLNAEKAGTLDAETARQHAVNGFERLLKQQGAAG